MHSRHVVDAGHDFHAFGQRSERDGVCAAVDDVGAAHRQKRSLRIQREFSVRRQVACLIVAQKRLTALAGPFHRAADPACRPGDQREFRIGRAARAEVAADVVHHHAHIVVCDAEHHRHVVARPHRAAGPGAQRIATGRGIVFADRRAWLHRHAGDALHRGAEPYHLRGGGERRVGRGGITDRCVEAEVRCRIRPGAWRVLHHRAARMHHCRQLRIVDDYQLCCILRCGAAGGHHHRDNVADMAHLIGGHRMVRRHVRRRSIGVLKLDVDGMAGPHRMRDRPQSIGEHVAAGQHCKNARCSHRRSNIDRSNVRVRVQRTEHHRVGLAGHVDVVAVAAASGQQAQIFPAAYRLADPCADGNSETSYPPRLARAWRMGAWRSSVTPPVVARTRSRRGNDAPGNDAPRNDRRAGQPPQSCVTMSSCKAAISLCTQSRNGDSPRPRMSSTVWLASMVFRLSSRPSAGAQPRR